MGFPDPRGLTRVPGAIREQGPDTLVAPGLSTVAAGTARLALLTSGLAGWHGRAVTGDLLRLGPERGRGVDSAPAWLIRLLP